MNNIISFGWNNSLFFLDENTLLIGNKFIYVISIKEPTQIICKIEVCNLSVIFKIGNQLLIGGYDGFLKCFNINKRDYIKEFEKKY